MADAAESPRSAWTTRRRWTVLGLILAALLGGWTWFRGECPRCLVSGPPEIHVTLPAGASPYAPCPKCGKESISLPYPHCRSCAVTSFHCHYCGEWMTGALGGLLAFAAAALLTALALRRPAAAPPAPQN